MRSRQQHSQSFGTDRRAVSSQIGYVLAIAIISILMAGLVSSTGGLVTQTTEQGTQAELQIIGDRISGQVMSADRILTGDDASSTLVLDANVPTRAGDESYILSYNSGELILKSTERDITVSIPLETNHDVVVESSQASQWKIYSDGEKIRIGTEEDASI